MWNKRPETVFFVKNDKSLLLCKRLRLCSRFLNDGAISSNRAEVEVTHRALKMACSSLGTTRVSAPPLSRLTQVYEQLNDCRAAIANHKVLLGHIFLAAAGLGFMTCVWVCLLRRGSSYARRPRTALLLPGAPR